MAGTELSYKQIKKEIRKNKAAKRRGPLAGYRMAFAFLFSVLTGLSDLWTAASTGEGIARAGIRFSIAFAIAWVALGVIDAVLASAGRRADSDN
jgi:hypothetical protein